MSAAKTKPRKYKHAPYAAWRHIENESLILNLDTSMYYSLNETGGFIWEHLGKGATTAQIASELCEAFDVKPEIASRDTDKVVAELCKAKLLLPD